MTKYRIIVSNSGSFPYCAQKKEDDLFSFWREIGSSDNLREAEFIIKKYIKLKIPRAGTVIKQYDEQDLVVDILKGETCREKI